MNMTQVIAALVIVSACTLLAVTTGTFKNPLIQLLLAGFVAVVMMDKTPTLPMMLWSAVFGLSYVLCIDWMVGFINPPKTTPRTPQAKPPTHRAQSHEQNIHDLFEFEPVGGKQ